MFASLIKRIKGKKVRQKYLKELGVPTSHNSQLDGLTPSLITIGKNFVSAPGSKIISHDSSLIPKEGILIYGTVILGDNVFVGANATILPNTEIGDNCIIGAGSVVKGRFESGSIIAGNPAKAISSRKEYLEKVKERGNFINIPAEYIDKIISKKLSFSDRREIEKIIKRRVE